MATGAAPELIDRMLELRKGRPADAEVVKRNPKRSVFRLQMGDRCLYVKWHRFRGAWDCLLALIRGTRAEREWQNIFFCRQHGILTASAMALGCKKRWGVPVQSLLATESVEARSLKETAKALAASREGEVAAERRHMVYALGKFVRKMHDANFYHPDLHCENILVPTGRPEFCLLDLHAARPCKWLSPRRRVQNLAFLWNSLGSEGHAATDTIRFLKAYLGSGTARDTLLELLRRIKAKSARLVERHIRSRSRRCVVKSSLFTTERTPVGRVFRRKIMSVAQVTAAIRIHDTVMACGARGRVVKRHPKVNITLIDWDGSLDARQLCVKEVVRGARVRLLPARLRHRPVMLSWKAAWGLEVRKVPGPEALAIVMGKGAGGYLIMRVVESAELLMDYLDHAMTPRTPVSKRRAFIRAAAGSLKKYYAAGVLHHDLKAGNVLVREAAKEEWDFILLDLAAVRFPRRISLRSKLLNLAQLNASTPLGFTWADRLRFLRILAQDEPELADEPALNEIARITGERGRIWEC